MPRTPQLTFRSRTARLGVIAAAALIALTGCATNNDGAPTAQEAPAEAAGTAADSVQLHDGWTKSAPAGDMTGAFGTLENTSDREVTVESVTSPIADRVELHETVPDASGNLVMRKTESGFVIPAGGSFVLEPGANHIMFLELKQSLLAGDRVELTVTFSDGSTQKITVVVKDYSGANESYDDMEGMDHGDMEHNS